jgi:membrane protease subunit HflC
MRRSLIAGLVVLLAALVVLYSAAFTVRADRQAIVLQFGEAIRVERDPGLHWKWPFLQNVVEFDNRQLFRDIQQREVTMQDQKRMLVDAYVVYRIVDPLQFLVQMRSVENWVGQLDQIAANILRGELGQMPFSAMLTPQRATFNGEVTRMLRDATRHFGVQVSDVRVTRADVPDANSEAIFARMRSERQREAAQERAAGEEARLGIRAEAEQQRTVLEAEARRQASVLQGAGDAQSTRIYAEAFGRDPQFFAFWRSLQAYQRALGDGSSTMVLSPEGDFFRYFNNMRGIANPPANPPASSPPPSPGAPRIQPLTPPSQPPPPSSRAPDAPTQAVPPTTQ